jgi:ribonuclease inhibitor
MIVEVDLSHIDTDRKFHEALAKALDFGPYYGYNLNALWDRMSTDVERPLELVLTNAAVCRAALGSDFEKILAVLEKATRSPAYVRPDNQFVLRIFEGQRPA